MGGSANDLFKIVTAFSTFYKTREQGGATTDNVSLRFQRFYTTGFLFLATGLISMNDLFGTEIACMDSAKKEASQAMNQYCWISGTYTIPGRDILHNMPGISSDDGVCSLEKNSGGKYYLKEDPVTKEIETTIELPENWEGKVVPSCKKEINYYQWVPYILMFQGLLFILPDILWKALEEGKMENISNGIRASQEDVKSSKEREDNEDTTIKNIAKFLKSDGSQHKKYAVGYVVVQLFSLVTVMMAFYMLDEFISGEFGNLGWRWLASKGDPNDLILRRIFPRVTACQWKQYGHGGHMEIQNFACILAANIVTEKIFVFLWFWYCLLALIATASLIYSLLLMFSSSLNLRNFFLMFSVMSTKVKVKKDANSEVVDYLKKVDCYRFYFLVFLASNLDYLHLTKVLVELSKESTAEETRPDEKTGLLKHGTEAETKNL